MAGLPFSQPRCLTIGLMEEVHCFADIILTKMNHVLVICIGALHWCFASVFALVICIGDLHRGADNFRVSRSQDLLSSHEDIMDRSSPDVH